MSQARTHAPLEYEVLGQYGKFVLLYGGLLAVLHKIRAGSDAPLPFEGRSGFIAALGDVADHFFGSRHGKKPKQIRDNNNATQRRLAKFLVETHERFAKSMEGQVPNAVRLLREKMRADDSLAAQLKGLKIALVPPVDFSNDAEYLSPNIVAPLLRIAGEAVGERTSHPNLPGIPAYNELALACQYSGIVEAPGDPAWKKTGLFSVVREARGPYTNSERDINIIVRDLLWMRRCTGHDPSGRMPDEENGPGGNIGFYFSALDGVVYEIRNLKIRNGMIMLDAISFMKTGAERSLCMYYPDSLHDHPLHCREGILMGTIRDEKRAGAWKTFIIRPDWEDLADLDVQLSVYLTYLEHLDRQQYNDAIVKCFEFVSQRNLVGVLYSREWARRYPELNLEATRSRFRTMLWEGRAQIRRDQIFVGNKIDVAVRNEIASLLAKSANKGERTLNGIMATLQHVLTNNWQLIEPPQLISSGYSPDTTKTDAAAKRDLQDLIRRETLLAYDRYAEQIGAELIPPISAVSKRSHKRT